MTCLPCDKELIDQGMGKIAARMYARVGEGMPVTVAAAKFYEDGVSEIFEPLARDLLTRKGSDALTDDQTARLMKQISEQCYNADELIRWSLAFSGASEAAIAAWTSKIFKWAKDDQTFYTALSAELKG